MLRRHRVARPFTLRVKTSLTLLVKGQSGSGQGCQLSNGTRFVTGHGPQGLESVREFLEGLLNLVHLPPPPGLSHPCQDEQGQGKPCAFLDSIMEQEECDDHTEEGRAEGPDHEGIQ